MKDLLVEANVPTAKHGTFTNEDEAIAFLSDMPLPYVIKIDGLAAGRELSSQNQLTKQRRYPKLPLRRRLGDAGKTVVIEEGLIGNEISILAICDGQSSATCTRTRLQTLLHNDEGPNTGGMGAFSPIPSVSEFRNTNNEGSTTNSPNAHHQRN